MTKRILCIGDKPENLALVQNVLEGYDVVLRKVPFREIREIEDLSPDLVILKLTPFADGLGRQLFTLLNREPSATSFPVLAFFASPEDILEQDRHTMRSNVFFVPWPYDISGFLTIVEKALQTSPFQRNES